jgi:two-component system, NarL family, sensor histidine kinase DegS
MTGEQRDSAPPDERLSPDIGPYTPTSEGEPGADAERRDGRFDGLHAEAKAALGQSANSLRSVAERYREAYNAEQDRWQLLRREIDAAESGGQEAGLRGLRSDMELLTAELTLHKTELGRLDLAQRSLENAWLFLERGDRSLVSDPMAATTPEDVQMRIVEAQEAERTRLAQEVHDGPAQALTNAIFQAEYIERLLEQNPSMAPTELRFLRELLRRELGDVRSFISQLRPPLLDELGLEGAIKDTAETMTTLTGLEIETDINASGERLGDAAQTVVLRVVQEALQNVRKHAAAKRVTVSTTANASHFTTEIADDGHGFDLDSVAARGRRNFGLQFMRERAELIGARFEVRSRPGEGTVVWLAIPIGEERG